MLYDIYYLQYKDVHVLHKHLKLNFTGCMVLHANAAFFPFSLLEGNSAISQQSQQKLHHILKT